MRKSIFFHDQQRVWLLVCWVFITFGCLPEEQRLTSVPAIRVSVGSLSIRKFSKYSDNFNSVSEAMSTSMGKIENIKCENNKIYISDGLTLFAFSEEGELALCLEKRGEAPDEYSGISDFVIDGENIIILTGINKKQ